MSSTESIPYYQTAALVQAIAQDTASRNFTGGNTQGCHTKSGTAEDAGRRTRLEYIDRQLASSEMDFGERQQSASPRYQGAKACVNCARIKCKCISRVDGLGCERCYRLKKTCVSSSAEKRRGPKRHAAASRSARLEEKLDGLVSLLKSQRVITNSDAGDAGDTGGDDSEPEEDTSPQSIATSSNTTFSSVYTDEPSLMEAEASLKTFREGMMPLCPYVYIPSTQTSVQLRHDYPFLWLTIMSVTSNSFLIRKSLSNQAKATIIQRVVTDGERTLDLLLGTLTFVNWFHLFPMDMRFASLASQLATTLICDLGLHMPPPPSPSWIPPATLQAMGIAQQPCRRERTIEERRAVLGAFVTTSMASCNLKATDGLRWSHHLDEYLDWLSRHSTVLQDNALATLVKIQLIFNQARQVSGQSPITNGQPSYADVLRSQLDDIIGSVDITNKSTGSSSILGAYHLTTLYIYDSAIARSATPWNEPDLRRFEAFQRCLTSIKAWLAIFFSTPLSAYAAFPGSTYSQLFHVMVYLYKITTIKDSAWDPTAAREVVDLIPTLDKIIYTFEQLQAAAPSHSSGSGGDEAPSMGIKKFQALKVAWQGELALKDTNNGTIQQDDILGDPQAHFTSSPMDYFNLHMLPSMFDDIAWQ